MIRFASKVGMVSALTAAGLVLAACSAGKEVASTVTETVADMVTITETGPEQLAPVTVTVTDEAAETEPIEAPEVDGPEEGEEDFTDESGVDVIQRSVGETAEDDGILFGVKSIREVESVQRSEYSEPPVLKPVSGARLILAEVTFKNNTKQAVDPFCGNGGTALIDAEQRNFDPVGSIFEIAGNEVCGDGLQPGFKQTVRIAYQVPKDAVVAGIALWNDDVNSPDWGGERSYVVFSP